MNEFVWKFGREALKPWTPQLQHDNIYKQAKHAILAVLADAGFFCLKAYAYFLLNVLIEGLNQEKNW